MTLSDICKGTYPACTKIKSKSTFITALFKAAGGTLYGSDSYKKMLFSGERPFTASLRESLPSQINTNALIDFFYNNIADTKLPDVVAGFGIPEKETIDKRALASALAIQLNAIIDSDNGSAEDVLILEYQNRKANAVDDAIIAPATALYPGDAKSHPESEYEELVTKKMVTDIQHHVQYIADKIENNGLGMHSFYIYIVPFMDAESNKSEIMDHVLKGDVIL